MTAVSLDGDDGGCGYALLVRCYGRSGPSQRKQEAVGMWTRTGSLKRSPCSQMARVGKVSRGTPDVVSGNRCCCCCTSCPGGNERGTSMPLDKLDDLMARGQR